MRGGFRNPLVTSATIADGAITSIKLASTLQSDNFVTGVSGWQLQRDTGNAEFNNVTVRGTIYASAGELGTLTVAGTLTGGIYQGGQIQTAASGNDRIVIGPGGLFSSTAISFQASSGTVVGRVEIANLGSLGKVMHISGVSGQTLVLGGSAIRVDTNMSMGAGTYLRIDDGNQFSPGLNFVSNISTGIYLEASNDLRIGINGILVARFGTSGGSASLVDIQGVYNTTTGSGANVNVASNGRLARSTSSKEYKTAIRKWDHRHSVLNLTPSLFRSTASNDDSRRTHLGLIAEDVRENFPIGFVAPDAINWNAIIAGLLAEVKELRELVNA